VHPRRTRSAPPSQSKSQFLGVFAGWLRFGGIFRRRRLKKVVNFFGKKVHPRRQNPGYAYGCYNSSIINDRSLSLWFIIMYHELVHSVHCPSDTRRCCTKQDLFTRIQYAIPTSMPLFQFPLPLVAQKLLAFPWEFSPMGISLPSVKIPMHTSRRKVVTEGLVRAGIGRLFRACMKCAGCSVVSCKMNVPRHSQHLRLTALWHTVWQASPFRNIKPAVSPLSWTVWPAIACRYLSGFHASLRMYCTVIDRHNALAYGCYVTVLVSPTSYGYWLLPSRHAVMYAYSMTRRGSSYRRTRRPPPP